MGTVQGLQAGVGADNFIPVTDIPGGAPQVCAVDSNKILISPCSLIDVPACELDPDTGSPPEDGEGLTHCPYLLVVTAEGDVYGGYWTFGTP